MNSNTDTTDNIITKTTDLLCKHDESFLQEKASKNTVIKILAENQQHANNTKEVDLLESFKTVKGTFINPNSNRKFTAAIDMIFFAQQTVVMNQIPLAIQKLCR